MMRPKQSNKPLRRLPCAIITITTSLLGQSFTVTAADKTDLDIYYKDNITHVVSQDGAMHLKPELRIQSRVSTPYDGNPDSIAKLNGDTTSQEIKRARLKVGGNINENLKVKFEYDLVGSQLLDSRLTYKFVDEFQFRFGRMKAHYSPERVTSSKDQQLVDRSIVNDWFNIDRQQGISFLGHLNKGTWADSNYWFDIFNGTGRDGKNENDHFMYVGRYQWNFLGEQMETAMGDLKFRSKPAAHFAVSATTNTSAYTKFSTSAPGQLRDFKDKAVEGVDDQFKLKQWMVDFSYRYNGVSFQTEYHQKQVDDRVNNEITNLEGYYVQVGFFPNRYFKSMPKELELAARFANVDPNTDISDNNLKELTLGANWFFTGHRNKLTFDISRHEIDELGFDSTGSETRFRLQHDFSF
ncbi:porin [Thalassotalea sp. LPB0316]|uniref:OprO/OprP family phosphate-selective porin n=1 Tax=Thalassotalea sp. LPB0316 TaxID=2769490 RepID=UPI001867CDEB|nr:porin [Thalassotalea sp. LPB0316]QOL25232.1 porin [Thalassotalea sp. LPB0316]